MSQPVFLDPTGRRWRHVRRVLLGVGIATTALAFALIAFALIPPALPALADARGDWQLARLPVWRGTRAARLHAVARRRLLASLSRHPNVAAQRPSTIAPLQVAHAGRVERTPEEFAAFYVNWDDNAFASLSKHAGAVDWVVAEWAFVVPGGDSLRINIDRRVPFLLSRMPPADRPRVLAMVSNIDSVTQTFDRQRLMALVQQPASRQRAIRQLVTLVRQWGLSGVTVDFEEIPDALHPAVRQFLAELRLALNAIPRAADSSPLAVTQAVSVDLASDVLHQYATLNDRLFLMVYDEHYGKGDPGPVASQAWYERQAQRALRVVPADKAVLAIGAYGYDWNDGGPRASGDAVTFQDVMRDAREHHAPMLFDRESLNPYVRWTDADSTDHVVWYLDGVTAWNQMAVGRKLGVRGHALWRLGAEDPSLWNALAVTDAPPAERQLPTVGTPATGTPVSVTALDRIASGYDVEFTGDGELLRIQQRPHDGLRATTFDSTLGVIVGQHTVAYSTPWIVHRFGAQTHKVALTFDDGPDAQWTPAILDTLRSRGVKATFFVIGTQVERNMTLLRRLVAEGHEVGNHTFSHPNLSLLPDRMVGMELDVNERLLEAALDQRAVFFRAPFFGDAEPTTADELVPAAIASDRGYVIAGLHVDSQDWQRPGVAAIIRNVLQQRARGNVVLLHDGGGNRAQTVAALGPLIDSLRLRGDTVVPLSALADGAVSAMVPLPAGGESARGLELAGFMMVGTAEWVLMWMFLVAVVLGIARVVIVSTLALIQLARERRAGPDTALALPGGTMAPSVAVIVPAYNESAVIVRTVETLLKQVYAGSMEILVVDDGSPDDTYAVASAAFAGDPQVRVFSKTNGGKASALNFGIGLTTADVVIGLDADTLFEPDTIARLVQPLHDPRVAAVAGNAKVGNRLNLVTRWQAIEYITSQNLDRRAFALLNGITVVPGAVGAWRRTAVVAAGGFSHDTLAEDQDLTLTLLKSGHRVAYAPLAIAWTEAPDTVQGLLKQRFRWSYGTLQCMWKHRQALLKPRYGSLGMVALPNTWVFQLLVNAVAPLADLMFLWTFVSVWLIGVQHGETYAVTALQQVLVLYAVFLLLDWGMTVLALITEPNEDWRLTWLVFLQRFAYRQMMYWVVVRSFVAAARGGLIGWGKLDRKATVQLPTT